jgi:hypothetical protein
MHSIVSRTLPGLLLLATSMAPLAAQEPPGFAGDLKFHLGYTPSPKDNLRCASETVGVNLSWGTAYGRLGLELGWAYWTGDGFIQPVGTAPATMAPVTASHSGDSRRNDLSGLMARLTLQRPTGIADLQWQVGLQLGGSKWNQQYFGDVSGGYKDTVSPNTWAWRDTYSGNLPQSGIGISPLAGVAWRLSEKGSLECNLVIRNYRSREYVHLPGTASTYAPGTDYQGYATSPISGHNAFPLDPTRTHSRWQPQLEIAYVFHF